MKNRYLLLLFSIALFVGCTSLTNKLSPKTYVCSDGTQVSSADQCPKEKTAEPKENQTVQMNETKTYICPNGSSVDSKDKCKLTLTLEDKIEECKNKYIGDKERCYENLAIQYESPDLCKEALIEEKCLTELAARYNKISYCGLVITDSYRWWCYQMFETNRTN